MADYVVIVEFRLKPDMHASFRRLVESNAIASVRSEPGCRRFDVLEPKDENGRIVLYEIYRDRAAFEDHLKTEHFAAFDAAAADLVTERTVSHFDLVCEASGPLASRGGSGDAAAAVAE